MALNQMQSIQRNISANQKADNIMLSAFFILNEIKITAVNLRIIGVNSTADFNKSFGARRVNFAPINAPNTVPIKI